MQATATVQTANAKRYLGQFCKHFAHKSPVEYDPAYASGKVPFGVGVCSLYADDEALELQIQAQNTADMTSLKDVVGRHLVRFAFREDIELNWQAPT